MIHIKNFDSSFLKIDKKSYKNIGIYYIGYITKKSEYVISTVNPLYLIINKIDGFIEEKEDKFSLKTRHIFKSCNIYLKPERFRKSNFTLSKLKSE